MAVKNTSYTLADILGEPITEQEALALIKQATDSDTFRSFNIMEEACRRKLLQFLMGKSGLSITYDSVFKHVMMPGGTTDRLEQFLSVILGEPVQIKQVLPQEGSQIAESGKKCSYFNTDIKLNLLENIIFISLDTFQSVVHNINTKQEAWLKFLTEDNPEKMVQFVNQYPEFLPYYQDIITFRKKPEELIHMFSDALREMDRNTERYMVEELNKQVEDLKTELNTRIAEKDSELAGKDALIQKLTDRLARYEQKAEETS